MVELSPEQAVQRARLEESQLNALQQQANQITNMIAELRATKAVLDNMPDGANNTLIPLGSGVFIEGSVTSTKTLIDVGLGNILEKNPADIIKSLEEREKALEEALKRIADDAQALGQDLGTLRSKLSDFARKQQAGPDVPVIG